MSLAEMNMEETHLVTSPVKILFREDAFLGGLVPNQQSLQAVVVFSLILMTIHGVEVAAGSWFASAAVRVARIFSVSMLSFVGKIFSSGTVAWRNLPRVLTVNNLKRLVSAAAMSLLNRA
eukprot:2427183-Rhodomonas_salina.2